MSTRPDSITVTLNRAVKSHDLEPENVLSVATMRSFGVPFEECFYQKKELGEGLVEYTLAPVKVVTGE